MKRFLVTFLVAALVAGCTTSPLGRSQLQLFPQSQMATMGAQAFAEMQKTGKIADDPALNRYAQCISGALLAALPAGADARDWETTVFLSDQANAFALPGGKIGIYTGLMKVADTADQLAAVVGHEIGHVIADHGNERLSTQFATTAGLTMIQVLAGSQDGDRQQALALLGLGAQVGIILPFSRVHETESDVIGLRLMAQAGFDPRAAVTLWQNMAARSNGAPPELLSTHPANETRIANLRSRMPEAMRLYEQARMMGRDPGCTPPATIPTAGDAK